ncbi:hypothetical protein DFH09DRAFT_1330890 [Mycena vulgaris]|nr:hypothetical protein DFH09DRAFT_1330890 [Mycena vulgaris]
MPLFDAAPQLRDMSPRRLPTRHLYGVCAVVGPPHSPEVRASNRPFGCQSDPNAILRSLVLRCLKLAAADLLSFLRHLPALEELVFEYSCINNELFMAFTYDPEGSVPTPTLPLLSSLGFADENYHLNGDFIADMVESMCEYHGGHNTAFPR